jgi:hypothetical protein
MLQWLLVLGMIAFSAGQVRADVLLSNWISRDQIRLTDRPCTDRSVLRYGKAGEALYQAHAYIHDRQRGACWKPLQQKLGNDPVYQVVLVLDNGVQLSLPIESFQEAPEA